MQSYYLDQIRSFEGYTPKAEWDYAQFTNGYGTKARYAGEVISKAEAERRFRTEISEARAIVDQAAPNVDEGTKAALTSLTYNAGPSWVRSGLGEAVRSGDLDRAREIFVQYNKAGGDVVPGLVNRRLSEVTWIGNPDGVSGAETVALNSNIPSGPLPGIPMTIATAVASEVPVSSEMNRTDALQDLLKAVSSGSSLARSNELPLKATEAKIVASASDAIESGVISDLALMAQAGSGAGGTGSVFSYYHGDVLRADEQDREKRSHSSVTA